jgi:hypothetical protein
MCGNPATVLICGEVAIPINSVLGVRSAQCGEFEICRYYPNHPDGDCYLCDQCAHERGFRLWNEPCADRRG